MMAFSTVAKCIFLNLMTRAVVIAGLYNAALFKPTIQSSNFKSNYAAYKGVDGNNDGNALNGHCQHTNASFIPWWMVDLRGQFVVEQIRLTNRQDVYQGIVVARRLRNFDIEIFQEDPRNLANFPNITGDVCYHQTAPLEPGTFNFTCPVPIIGRFVRLVMRPSASDVIHICEMEVLVSSVGVQDFYYTLKENFALQGTPLDEITFRDSSSCLQACLHRRSTDYCTAFNWVTSTKLCRLFSVNPYLNIAANLTFALGTNFYIEISTFG